MNGRWLLRIDDLDTPRVAPGAIDAIQRQLEAHALLWDEAPRFQSGHMPEYREALDRLLRLDALYACTCTRAMLRGLPASEDDEPIYPGTCRDARKLGRSEFPVDAGESAKLGRSEFPSGGAALRVRLPPGRVSLHDGGLGLLERDLESGIGDFVVRRRDGQIGYQLACVVDEAAQGITEVVRGADLIGSSLRQVHLMKVLDLPIPEYRHLPLLLDAGGRKLSKQNHAPPIEVAQAVGNLRSALRLLGQDVPDAGDPTDLVAQAVTAWDPAKVPKIREIRT